MKLPIIINYFECENCFDYWRVFRNANVYRSRCKSCDTWNHRVRIRVIDDRNSDYKAWGKFECRCGNEWTSAHCWILYRQKCRRCKKKSDPVHLYDNFREEDDYNPDPRSNGKDKMHDTQSCTKCLDKNQFCPELPYKY
jgi:hypothetical protein